MYRHNLRKAPNENAIIIQFKKKSSSFVYLSVTVLNDVEGNIIRFLNFFFFLLNVGSDKWISAYALIALKICVAMAQFLHSNAVLHLSLV